MPIHLHVGGVVAMGFDPAGRYLLVVSHAGRGLFEVANWNRVARDATLAYPQEGMAVGIGPIEGKSIQVTELNYESGELHLVSPDGTLNLDYESGTITISEVMPNNRFEYALVRPTRERLRHSLAAQAER